MHLLKHTNTLLKSVDTSTLELRKHLLANVAAWFHDLAELVPNTIQISKVVLLLVEMGATAKKDQIDMSELS